MAKALKAAKKAAKGSKAKVVKKVLKSKKPVKKVVKKTTVSKAKSGTSRRLLSDIKIAKLQKMYKSAKHSAQKLCDEFGISMATLFNYLKVKV